MMPADIIRRRFTAGLRNFFSLYQPIADACQMFDNSEIEPLVIASGGRTQVPHIADETAWNHLLKVQR
jgi:predicted ABC-type ATPase